MRNLNNLPAWIHAPVLIAGAAGFPILGRALGITQTPLGTILLAGAAFAFVVWGSVSWWRRLDEAAKEAHKFAWYWGASLGMAAAVVAFVAMFSIDPNLITTGLHGGATPEAFIELGVIGVLAPQMIGYLVAWAGWWISKR